ncbi:MAG: hypothetical protein IJ291_01945 [Lachnospiraceae bacterium]|nr:hypothetical protein [Lachnospiraceae bacterium]
MKKQAIKTFEEAVQYLYDMPRFTTKNTPEDTRLHLEKLGSPDKQIPSVIHVG